MDSTWIPTHCSFFLSSQFVTPCFVSGNTHSIPQCKCPWKHSAGCFRKLPCSRFNKMSDPCEKKALSNVRKRHNHCIATKTTRAYTPFAFKEVVWLVETILLGWSFAKINWVRLKERLSLDQSFQGLGTRECPGICVPSQYLPELILCKPLNLRPSGHPTWFPPGRAL